MGEVPGRRHAIGEVPGRSGASREVPGRRPDVSETGSDDSTPYCQPCINVLATAFCNDCCNYFCSPCTDYHRKMALTKNHNLLVGSAMLSFYAGQPVGATARGKLNPVKTKCCNKKSFRRRLGALDCVDGLRVKMHLKRLMLYFV